MTPSGSLCYARYITLVVNRCLIRGSVVFVSLPIYTQSGNEAKTQRSFS